MDRYIVDPKPEQAVKASVARDFQNEIYFKGFCKRPLL